MLRNVILRSLTLVAVALLLVDCNEEEPTTAIIYVQDTTGARISGAYVKLFANPSVPLGDPSRLTKEGYTDGGGAVEFDYSDYYKQGQAGFAVLDIHSTHDSLAGEGIIKILEEETNEETVTLEFVGP
jgi:hypothetical protein